MTAPALSRRPLRTLAFIELVYRQLLPWSGTAASHADDAIGTMRQVCLAAYRRRGWLGLVREGVLEWMNAAGEGLRQRRPGSPHEPRRSTLLARLWHDLQLGWRGLVANRASAGIAVATLTLGIGLGTSVFSILDSILWRPVPYPDAGRLVELASFNTQRKFSFFGFDSPAVMREWRRQTDLFDRLEGYDTPSLVYTTDAGSEMVAGAVVTPGLFSMLGGVPSAGRIFVPGDGRTGTETLAIVSDAFWRGALKKDPNAVGRELTFDGDRYRIAGIMPASFRFPNGQVQVWLPYDIDEPPAGPRAARTMAPIARLASGWTFAAAAKESRARGSRISASAGEDPALTAEIDRIGNFIDDRTTQSLWILMAAVGFLFLVVCANVANLSLARSIQHARDLAVRAALGASRYDLLRETFVESGLIAVVGCLGGTGLAWLLTQVALNVLPDSMTSSALNPIRLDGRALACGAGLGAVSAVLFGLPAAIVASRASVSRLLGGSSRGASASSASRRLRSALVVAEVSVSIVLLVGAALMTRSFLRLQSADRGFDTTNLISVRLGFPSAGYADAKQRDQFMQDVAARLRSTPGVRGVSTTGLPTDVRPIMLGPVEFGQRPGALTAPLIVPMHDVPPDYFSMIGIHVLEGRTFLPEDGHEAVVVSDAFARKYWPDGKALGGRFRGRDQQWQTVIGIVGDIGAMDPDQRRGGQDLYFQAGRAPQGMVPRMPASSIAEYRNLVLRADHPAQTISVLPALIHGVDGRVVIWRTALVDHLYADAIARPRTVLALMGAFAVVGLLLALAGMYGVLSYLVTQRVREIGIRLALGAKPADIGRLVLASGLTLTAAGLIGGLALSFGLMRTLRTLLYEVGPSDPMSMAAVAILLLVTALAASWRPARRAMRVDPVQLLRQE